MARAWRSAHGYILKGADKGEVLRTVRAVAGGEALLGPAIAQGLTNQQIAERLYISPKTVSNHISNVFAKLHLDDRAAAIVKAREAGLGRSLEEG